MSYKLLSKIKIEIQKINLILDYFENYHLQTGTFFEGKGFLSPCPLPENWEGKRNGLMYYKAKLEEILEFLEVKRQFILDNPETLISYNQFLKQYIFDDHDEHIWERQLDIAMSKYDDDIEDDIMYGRSVDYLMEKYSMGFDQLSSYY